MAKFVIGKPIETVESKIEVTVDAASPLAFGEHRFSLQVIDDSKNISDAVTVIVRVADLEKPLAVLAGPEIAGLGASFPLSGEKSRDLGGGRIAKYVWTYLGPVSDPIVPRVVRPVG